MEETPTIIIRFWAEPAASGWRAAWHDSSCRSPHVEWKKRSQSEALAVAEAEACTLAARYVGDWHVVVEPRPEGDR